MPNGAVEVEDDGGRLQVVDAARGFALVGVLLINVAAFSGYPSLTPDERAALPTASLDRSIIFGLIWLGMGKFYSLFSLLFGFGFALQMDSAARRGDHRLTGFRRRLLVLLCFGLVHLVFWEGDILLLYGSLGFLLLGFRHMRNQALVRFAIVLLLAPVALSAAIYVSGGLLDPGAPLAALARRVDVALGFPENNRPVDVLATAGWGTYLLYQVPGPLFRYADILSTGRPFKVLAMFLLGLALGRSGMLRDPTGWEPFLRRLRNVGFAVGLPGSAAYTAFFVMRLPADSPLKIGEAAAYAVGIAPLALAYGAGLLLLWQNGWWRARLAHLAPAGRMALTNYLSQTAIAVFAFYGVGLGLMGQIGPALWLPYGVLVFGAQVLASQWWLTRFRYGPLEWIWRQASYGRRVPLRRAAGAPSAL